MPLNLVSRREDRVAPKLSSDEDEEKAIMFDSRSHPGRNWRAVVKVSSSKD
jgi:hypothetical protein